VLVPVGVARLAREGSKLLLALPRTELPRWDAPVMLVMLLAETTIKPLSVPGGLALAAVVMMTP
jgi:hypothetical protein